jgi:hypothetical protein
VTTRPAGQAANNRSDRAVQPPDAPVAPTIRRIAWVVAGLQPARHGKKSSS